MLSTLLAVAIAIGSWVQVPGGSWDPDPASVADAKTKLRPYATEQARLRKSKLPAWNEYTFQYHGREIDGHKLIYVNAFCIDPPDDIRKQMVFVFDGGNCFFSAYYDPINKTFTSIRFNGYA
jgi:hypothetical protein